MHLSWSGAANIIEELFCYTLIISPIDMLVTCWQQPCSKAFPCSLTKNKVLAAQGRALQLGYDDRPCIEKLQVIKKWEG